MRAYRIVGTLALALVAVAVPAARAAEPGSVADNTVAAWRDRPRPGTPDTDAIAEIKAVASAEGMIQGAAVFVDCRARMTVGELEAYLQYTADPGETVVTALDRFLAQKGCAPQDAENRAAVQAEARATFARGLAVLRAVTDEAILRGYVAQGESRPDDPEAVAVGLVAGARLLELRTGDQRAPSPQPQDIRR